MQINNTARENDDVSYTHSYVMTTPTRRSDRPNDVVIVANDNPVTTATRRSHGTWAHGATTAGYVSDATSGLPIAPPTGRADVMKHPSDVTPAVGGSNRVEERLRTAVSCSTAVVKSTGDVSFRRRDVTVGDIVVTDSNNNGSNRRHNNTNTMPSVAGQSSGVDLELSLSLFG